jgi:hypothetical protein
MKGPRWSKRLPCPVMRTFESALMFDVMADISDSDRGQDGLFKSVPDPGKQRELDSKTTSLFPGTTVYQPLGLVRWKRNQSRVAKVMSRSSGCVPRGSARCLSIAERAEPVGPTAIGFGYGGAVVQRMERKSVPVSSLASIRCNGIGAKRDDGWFGNRSTVVDVLLSRGVRQNKADGP